MSRLNFPKTFSIRLLPVALVTGLALVTGSCSGGVHSFGDLSGAVNGDRSEYTFTAEIAVEPEDLFPVEVADLHLAGALKGEEALPLVVDFLGPSYEIKDTGIAFYNGAGKKLNFWIVEMYDEADACALIERIHARITRSMYFVDHREYEDDLVCGYLYYARFCGKDSSLEHNFYYRKGTRIYWASICGEKQLDTIKPFLEQF